MAAYNVYPSQQCRRKPKWAHPSFRTAQIFPQFSDDPFSCHPHDLFKVIMIIFSNFISVVPYLALSGVTRPLHPHLRPSLPMRPFYLRVPSPVGEEHRLKFLGDAWRAPKVGRCRLGEVLERVSPLQPTRESGERRELPRGSGAEPRSKTDFCVFWRPQNAPFAPIWQNQRGEICIRVPYSKFWGTCPHVSPLIYAHGEVPYGLRQRASRGKLYCAWNHIISEASVSFQRSRCLWRRRRWGWWWWCWVRLPVRELNRRPLDRESDALPLRHRVTDDDRSTDPY